MQQNELVHFVASMLHDVAWPCNIMQHGWQTDTTFDATLLHQMLRSFDQHFTVEIISIINRIRLNLRYATTFFQGISPAATWGDPAIESIWNFISFYVR